MKRYSLRGRRHGREPNPRPHDPRQQRRRRGRGRNWCGASRPCCSFLRLPLMHPRRLRGCSGTRSDGGVIVRRRCLRLGRFVAGNLDVLRPAAGCGAEEEVLSRPLLLHLPHLRRRPNRIRAASDRSAPLQWGRRDSFGICILGSPHPCSLQLLKRIDFWILHTYIEYL